jgi:hypothetical protein
MDAGRNGSGWLQRRTTKLRSNSAQRALVSRPPPPRQQRWRGGRRRGEELWSLWNSRHLGQSRLNPQRGRIRENAHRKAWLTQKCGTARLIPSRPSNALHRAAPADDERDLLANQLLIDLESGCVRRVEQLHDERSNHERGSRHRSPVERLGELSDGFGF